MYSEHHAILANLGTLTKSYLVCAISFFFFVARVFFSNLHG
eukprot:UN12853